MMPGMDGIETLREIKLEWATLRPWRRGNGHEGHGLRSLFVSAQAR
jgi:CheY-like chemotaxis protein